MSTEARRRIYLAGKITKNDWREGLVSLRDVEGDGLYRPGEAMRDWPVVEAAFDGLHDYVGPFFVSCDHGCYHGPNNHGVGANDGCHAHESPGCGGEMVLGQHDAGASNRGAVYALCVAAIRRCDTVFAWIDDPTAHGTLVELGIASALGKRVLIAGPQPFPDLWFAYETASSTRFGDATPLDAFWSFFPRRWTKERNAEYLNSAHWQKRRSWALSFAGNACQLCNKNERLQVHHRTYERLGRELLPDMIVLCEPCHKRFHGIAQAAD